MLFSSRCPCSRLLMKALTPCLRGCEPCGDGFGVASGEGGVEGCEVFLRLFKAGENRVVIVHENISPQLRRGGGNAGGVAKTTGG